MTVLDEIFANKRCEVEIARASVSLESVRSAADSTPVPKDFQLAVTRPVHARPRLIAEVKRASPSKGLLVQDFNPVRLASTYRDNGASAISVLTDKRYFQGCLEDLAAVAALQPGLPVLRKDFIFDPYQIFEARAAGASAILLIAAMLDPILLFDLFQLASGIHLSVLIEVHDQPELEWALTSGTHLIGINNRNLHDLKVDLETTLSLRPHIPAGICVVAESGIQTRADIDRLADVGIDAILVGEALVTSGDTPEKVRSLAL